MSPELDFGFGTPRFADLVFHVLAHVAGLERFPASVYDPAYVAFSAETLGAAEARRLAEDARLLADLVTSHEELARLQLLAWLFRTTERMIRIVDRDLSDLDPADVDEPALLPMLQAAAPASELLRAAVELERPEHARLPELAFDRNGLGALLAELVCVAPVLASSRISVVRALGRHGRVRDSEIWVGAPFPGGPSVEHLAWQAAHEATVAELVAAGASLAERAIERAAIALLTCRADRHGLEARHRVWLEHFQPVPEARLELLPGELRGLVQRRLGGA